MHTFTFKTLPDLQAYLDDLRPGDQFNIPSADYIHLFGRTTRREADWRISPRGTDASHS